MNSNSDQAQLEHGPQERAAKQPKLEHKQETLKLPQEGEELKLAEKSEKETSFVNGDKEETTCMTGQQINAATKEDAEEDQMNDILIARKDCNATAIQSTLSGPAPTDNHGSTMHTASGENVETTERPVLSQALGMTGGITSVLFACARRLI